MGDTDADALDAPGDVAPGVKEVAFGLGVNDVALTFNRLFVFGDSGVEPEPALTPFVCRVAEPPLLAFALLFAVED